MLPFVPRGSPQVTRISTSTARLCKDGLGRRPATGRRGRTEDGTRLYCESAVRRPAGGAGAWLQLVLSIVLDKVFIVF